MLEFLIADIKDRRMKRNEGGTLVSSYDRSNAIKPKKIKLLYGSGCKKGGASCFECPLPECEWYGYQLSQNKRDW